jgi:chemotaxis protein CheZ
VSKLNTIVIDETSGTSDKSAPEKLTAQQENVLIRVGHLTRNLHDSLRGLGLDKLIEKAAHEIPSVKDRLNYVTKMSEQAAQRVLNATDAAGPLQDKIEETGGEIRKEWLKAMEGFYSDKQYRALAGSTIQFLEETNNASVETRKLLLEIMMAQDFQDLTGQVIKKITDLVTNMEQQLVQLLIDYAPSEMKRDAGSGLLNGPQINPTMTAEVVANQGQVDDLLESLGF